MLAAYAASTKTGGWNVDPGPLIPITDPIKSVFATVRHRTVRTKGALSHRTACLMVFRLMMAASKTWRRLRGENRLPLVIAGVEFTDGVADTASASQRAA